MSVLRSVATSFQNAGRGVFVAFRTERSFRIQAFVALVVVLMMLLLPLSVVERVILLLAIAAVLVLELLNSMVERLVDLVKPRLHGYVRDIKDLMAAAVLIASVFAAVVGALILVPHLSSFIFHV
ncbi:diacylglycerol kinase [Patescibacteria group bacterium]|jgi:undecaprenol kinase|nr:diacylglycerol kinase [Patescibacteria group bacterium]